MSVPKLTSARSWPILAVAAVAVGAAAWGAARWAGSADADVGLPKELTVEQLQAAAANPGQAMDAIRDAMDRNDLTDEQRRQAFRNMREVWMSAMNERVAEYFAAPEEDKVVILDEHIDEMERFREAMEARRKEWEERREAREQEGSPPRGFMGPQNREERKARSESRDPDQTAQRMAYFMAISNRMTQRGIAPPFGRGRGPGRRP